jgi:predicted transcriptional regulator
MEQFINKYREHISFSLSCYDRLVITGNLKEISYPQGMTNYVYEHKIMVKDYIEFAKGLREKLRKHIETLAQENGISIQYLNCKIRKETLVSKILNDRGSQSGIVCILSTVERCNAYKPWHDKQTGRNFLKNDDTKCNHYYIYFIDDKLGLCYIRIPTLCPFRLQIYYNGHNLLACKLKELGIDYTMLDNAFDSISDAVKAQELSDSIRVEDLKEKFDEFAWKYCPIYKELGFRYHWTVMQAEYSTDLVFRKQEDLQPIYREIIATSIHTVKPEHIGTFLGRKLDPRYQGEVGNNYNVRKEGTCIKHLMGEASIKMYDKFSKILRIETTCNDISFFKHYREVEHRDGTKSNKNAHLKKNIFSLSDLAQILKAANKRYIDFISAFDNKNVGRKRLERVTESKTENNRNYKGFNFFNKEDLTLLLAIQRGEFNINGFRNKHIKKLLNCNSSKISRLIKRLWVHGLVKKVADSYKYYLTKPGKETIIMSQKIKEMVIVPAFCY